jgi:hypothetical protein
MLYYLSQNNLIKMNIHNHYTWSENQIFPKTNTSKY